MPRLIDCTSLRQGKEKSLVFQTSQSKQNGFFRILKEKKNNQLKRWKRMNYATIILQKANRCLSVAAPDGKERSCTYSVKEKVQFHDLNRQN